MSYTKFLYLLLFSAAINHACSNKVNTVARETVPIKLPIEKAGIYQGLIPCADCPGIIQTVKLDTNSRYDESRVYIGRTIHPITTQGTYSLNGDTISLLGTDANKNPSKLLLSDNRLELLPLIAQDASYKKPVLNKKPNNTGFDPRDSKKSMGIDFIAIGNEPSWFVDMDQENYFKFQLQGNDIASYFPPQAPVFDSKEQSWTYAGNLEDNTYSMVIRSQQCSDNMSDERFNYSVQFSLNGQTYKGCGEFLDSTKALKTNVQTSTPEASIYSKWVLEEFHGNKAKAENFGRNMPEIEFSPGNKVAGSTGCNRFSGKATIAENSLKIEGLISTRMACQNSDEHLFIDAMQKVNTFKIEGDKLLLLSNNKVAMKLKKR